MHFSQIRSSNRNSGNFNNSANHNRDGFSNARSNKNNYSHNYSEYFAPVEVKYTYKELTQIKYSQKDINDTVKMLCKDKNLYIDPKYLFPDCSSVYNNIAFTVVDLNNYVAELMNFTVRRN